MLSLSEGPRWLVVETLLPTGNKLFQSCARKLRTPVLTCAHHDICIFEKASKNAIVLS